MASFAGSVSLDVDHEQRLGRSKVKLGANRRADRRLDSIPAGGIFGGNVRAVFTLITFIFVGCVLVTLYSFSEIPLDVLADTSQRERFTVKKNTPFDRFWSISFLFVFSATEFPWTRKTSDISFQNLMRSILERTMAFIWCRFWSIFFLFWAFFRSFSRPPSSL